jgi:hypothetical protein
MKLKVLYSRQAAHSMQYLYLHYVLTYVQWQLPGGWLCPMKTDPIQRSPYWGIHGCSAWQKSPGLLWNQKVHHRIHNSPPLVPILRQVSPVHTIPPYFFQNHFNIILPPMSMPFRWSSYALLISPSQKVLLLVFEWNDNPSLEPY